MGLHDVSAAQSVGLNVPLAAAVLQGIVAAAASENVSVRLLAPTLPPTSDMSTTFLPFGPVIRMSTSAATVWENPEIVAVTAVRAPETPDAVMLDGYGVAGPMKGKIEGVVIAVAFVNTIAYAAPARKAAAASATARTTTDRRSERGRLGI
jgi:hypothetical protein